MFIYVYGYNVQIEGNYLGRGGRQTGGRGTGESHWECKSQSAYFDTVSL